MVSYGENLKSLSHLVSVPGCDTRTDGWTDRITVANTSYSYASSHT